MGVCQSSSTPAKQEEMAASPHSNFSYRRGICALEYYEPIQELGEGSISSIHLVKRRASRIDVPYKERVDIMSLATNNVAASFNQEEELFALKSIIKQHVKNQHYLQEMRNEITTMSQLHHPNVIEVFEAFERKRHIYLIMEYCSGGDLVGREPNEAEASCIVRKVLQAVEYLHSREVVHRDIKLENIMFDKPAKDAQIKLIDFGLSCRYYGKEYLTDRVGTLYSMAPQVLQGVYDYKCDVYSIGVVAYVLLSGGQFPFWGPPREMTWEARRKIMMDRILKGQYMKMTGPAWVHVSKEAKDFCKSLMQMDPDKRPTATEALQSPWMIQTAGVRVEYSFPNHKQYVQEKEWKQTAKHILVEKLTNAEIIQLRDVLAGMDKQGHGSVTAVQFREALALMTRLSKDDVESIAPERMITNRTTVDYVSLINTIVETKSNRASERMAEALASVDTNGNGQFSKEDIYMTLKNIDPKAALDEIMDAIVPDDNGMVSMDQVLDVADKQHAAVIQSLLNPTRDADNVEASQLVSPKDVVIPGGWNDENEVTQPKYRYDRKTESVRKFEA